MKTIRTCSVSTYRTARYRFLALASTLALGSFSLTSEAADRTWTGSASIDWYAAGNWSPAGVPNPVDNLTINGGTLNISPPFTVSNRLTWNGGTMSGALTVASNGVMQMAGAFNFQGPITNAGTVVWTGGGLWYMQAPFVNLSGALFDWRGDREIYDPVGASWFINEGTFLKSAGSYGNVSIAFRNTGIVQGQIGILHFYGACQNSGLIQAQNGAQVLFSYGGTLTGTYETAAGSVISLAGGLFTGGEPLSLVGPGQIQLAGGTLYLPTDLIPGLSLVSGTVLPGPAFQGGSITNLTLSGLTLGGTNTVSGTLTMNGGTVSGPLTVAGGGVMQLGGANAFQGPITNAGTVVWTGGAIWYMQTPFVNLYGALFDWQGDREMYDPAGTSWFLNEGTFRKSAGSYGHVSIAFRNTGTVQLESGWMRFNSRLDNAGTLEAVGGTLGCSAVYAETASANLVVSLGGTATSAYGHLDFANAPTFNGQFTVRTHNGFRPAGGDAFVVLTYPSATTTFTCLNGLDLGGGILLVPSFSPTKLTLTATTYTVTDRPQLFISRAPGAVRLTWQLGFPGWKLLTTTNLTAPVWVEAPIQCGNQALVPIREPMAFFQLAQ